MDRLPEVKGVPFQRNTKFLGRDGVLTDLHRHLKDDTSHWNATQRACVIHGLGGVGKTQVALEYTYRYRHEYSWILWVRAESSAELAASYGNLAQELAPASAGADQGKNADVVRDWLTRNNSWLLVLDNLSEPHLDKYWPSSSHGSIIITTQLQSVTQHATYATKLEAFDEEQGARLILDLVDPLRRSTAADDVDHARRLSNELGSLPILLSHVAGFMNGSKCPLKDLLRSLQEPTSFRKVWAYDSTTSTNFQYGEPMEKVWKLALSVLIPEAITTLHIMAFLHADGVEEDVLVGDWDDPELSFLSPAKRFEFVISSMTVAQANETNSFHQVRQSLSDRHLVTVASRDGKVVLSMHRSLKQYLLHVINETDRTKLQTTFNRVLQIVHHYWPSADELQAPRAESWQECESCLPYVLSIVSIFSSWAPNIEGSELWATILADTAVYMWERGLVKTCLKLIEIGEQVCDSLMDAGHVATIHADLCVSSAGLAQDTGYRGRDVSTRQCQKALALRQKRVDELQQEGTVGKTDILRLANAWNDVGVAMIFEGNFEKAMPSFQESLRLKRLWENEDSLPWHMGETYKNMAFVWLARGQLVQAKAYAHRATELCSRGLPEESAAVQKARYIEALVLMNCHEHDRALRIHKNVMLARVKIFGESNPFTKDSLYTIGELYRLKEKWSKAEVNFRRALENSQDWSEEAKARTQHRLADVIRQAADLSDQRAAEAQKLENAARMARNAYLQSRGHLPETALDEYQLHDMMVSLWAGRMDIAPPMSGVVDLSQTQTQLTL